MTFSVSSFLSSRAVIVHGAAIKVPFFRDENRKRRVCARLSFLTFHLATSEFISRSGAPPNGSSREKFRRKVLCRKTCEINEEKLRPRGTARPRRHAGTKTDRLFPLHPQAVKLESLRAGRTRYLVVVSRPIPKHAQQLAASSHISGSSSRNPVSSGDTVTSHPQAEMHHLPTTSSSNSNSISLNPTSYFNEATSSGGSRFSAIMSACDNDSIDDDSTIQCPLADDNQCETESNVGSSCSRSSSNEIEESCLLGIDCNEKTTVGLVLKVLADTAIRLDGDG